MRRRFYLLTSVVVVLVVTSSLFFVAERQRTPDWREELYAQEPGIQVVQMDRAQQPQNFVDDASLHVASYGRFQYQRSDQSGQPTIEKLALPHPPKEVRCVLGTRANQEQAFFVNFYSDNLWNHEWLVYAGPTRAVGGKFDAPLAAMLEQLACDLIL